MIQLFSTLIVRAVEVPTFVLRYDVFIYSSFCPVRAHNFTDVLPYELDQRWSIFNSILDSFPLDHFWKMCSVEVR